MEKQQLEKAIYEAIIRIRKINKKRPHEKNILTEASKTNGLAMEQLRETLFSLVNSGNIRVVKTIQGNDSYYISNIDDYEDLVELESQADTSSDLNEAVNIDLTTPHVELEPKGEANFIEKTDFLTFLDTPHVELEPKGEANIIEKTDFLTFLDIVGKLTEDVRGLQLTINESARKNEKLLLENYELKLENNRLHSKLKESQIVENANTEFKSVCGMPRPSRSSVETSKTCSIVVEDIHDNEIVRNYNGENSKNNKKRIQKQDQSDKQPSRFSRNQKRGTTNEGSEYSHSMNKLDTNGTTEIHKKGRRKESEIHINRKAATTVIIGDSMVKNVQSWRMRKSLSKTEKVYVKSFPGATTDEMSFYSVPTSRKRPDRIILHTGVNDLNNENDNEKVTEDILTLAESIKSDETQIFISGLIKTADKEKNARIHNINNILKDECMKRHIGFIDNGNIDSQKHLNQSGLHLNRFGDARLASNYLSVIRRN